MHFLRGSGRHPRLMRSACVAFTLVSLTGCIESAADASVRTSAVVRVSLLRLSDQQAWQPCLLANSTGLIGSVRCGRDALERGDRVAQLSRAAVSRSSRSGGNASAASLASEVQWASVNAAAATRAESALNDSLATRPTDAALLNWLTIVRLARAERSQSLSDLLQALDAGERARRSAPASATAAFNLGVVHERLRLLDNAIQAFEASASLEPDSAWRAEAKARAEALRAIVQPAWATLPPDSQLARGSAVALGRIRERAGTSSIWRRELAFLALGEWGRNFTAGAVRESDAALALAASLGTVEQDVGPERSVTTILAHITAAQSQPTRLRQLAMAHSAFATGLALYRRGAFEAAQPLFRSGAQQLRSARSPMAAWARIFLGYCHSNLGQYDEALAQYATVREAAERSGDAALRARTSISFGTVHARTSRSQIAEQWYRRAVPDLVHVGDNEALGQVAFLISEVALTQGRRFDSQTESLRSVELLAPFRQSSYLQSEIAQLARLARTERQTFAALGIMRETLALSFIVARPNDVALAYADRARDFLAIGQDSAALADADSATTWMRRLQPGPSSARLRALVEVSRGIVLRKRAPTQSLQVLRDAVGALRPYSAELFLPNALHETALSARAAGHDSLATRLLDEAIVRLEQQYDGFQTSGRRAAFGETVEKVYDTALAVELDAKRGDRALALLERGRVASWHIGRRRADDFAGADAQQVMRMLPDQTVLVEYAVLADRVAIWAVSRSGMRLTSRYVTRDSLRRLIDRLPKELVDEQRPSAASARAKLFDLLLRSVVDSLPAESRVVVVPDRELFRVPFAALWDSHRQSNAIEQLEFRSAPSAAFAIRSFVRRVRVTRNARVVAIGNDAQGITGADALQPLTHSEAEARAVRAVFARGELLTGRAALRARLVRAVTRASVLHFAGHAVFDEERPERSYLLLASDRSMNGDRYLAGEIAMQRPSDLQLVVLSACRSLGARDTRMGPVTGLAFSFLESGASGIVSTMWDVSDDATAPIVTLIHQQLVHGESPATALRNAQLQAMRSRDPAVRSAKAWAAFTFSGT
jgi:CHAT domain-containing protein